MAERRGAAPLARTSAGDLRGTSARDLALFRGVPYAAPPIAELRFAPPHPHPGWTGVRDATGFGPSAPQPRSRLESVMGRVDFDQDEDCLTLNIWSPPPADGPYPVLLWLHGGAFATGSASWPFYSGAQLARNGRLVVVTANYRLGALGYLYVPELASEPIGAANRGLLDQMAALTWVHDNIAAFGGDPEAITVAGQSAGGAAIAAMIADARARRLFQRAILQSPVVEPPSSIDEAAQVTDHLLHVLGISRTRIAELRGVPVAHLLQAQIETAGKFARFGAPVGPIQQVADGVLIPEDLIQPARDAAATGMALLAGTTRDEMDAFLMQDDLRYATRSEIIRMLRVARLPGFTDTVFDAYVAAAPRRSPAKTASAVLTDLHFRSPTLRFVDAWSASRGSAYLYRFDWTPLPNSRYGACHCIDIPFALNNLEDWQSSPVRPAMLEGCDSAQVEALSRVVQNAWAAFAHSGRPGHSGLPPWPDCAPSRMNSMQVDVETHVAVNPDSDIRPLWSAP